MNRTRSEHPRVPLSMLLRRLRPPARREQAGRAARGCSRAIHAWFDHYLRGDARGPPRGVTAYTETCPRGIRRGTVPRAARSPGSRADRAISGPIRPDRRARRRVIRPLGRRSTPWGEAGTAASKRIPRRPPGTARYVLRKAKGHAFTRDRRAAPTREVDVKGGSPARPRSTRASGTSRPTVSPRSSWPAACTGRGTAPTAGSFIRQRGVSGPATPRCWSCSATTRRSRGPQTGASRSTCAGCG